MSEDWYRPVIPWGHIYTTANSGEQVAYRPDVSASPMGCLEQWQWCNSEYPRDRGCGPLASYWDAVYGAAPLFNLSSQDLDPFRPSSSSATGTRLIWPFLLIYEYPNRLAALLGSLGTKSLESQTRLFSGIQFQIPENQWQMDVLNWWNTILASIQASWLVNPILHYLACSVGHRGSP